MPIPYKAWLKAVNSETALAADDMGHDGDTGNNATKHIARDAFGYSLSYFSGAAGNDYKARFPGAVTSANRNVFKHTTTYASNTTVSGGVGLKSDLNLYNGNIKQMVTAVRDLSSNTGNKVYGSLNRYQYDQLQRIKKLRGNLVDYNGTSHTLTPNVTLGDYAFDRSGNLTTLKRSLPDGSGTTVTDDFSYKYEEETVPLGNGQADKKVKKHNKLLAVYDAVGVKMNDDLMDQLQGLGVNNPTAANHGFSATNTAHHNYKYDVIGQLTHDFTEKLKMYWRVDGKVAKVERFRTLELKTAPTEHVLKDYFSIIEFQYDGLGNRVAKKVSSYAADGVTVTGIIIHYYVRDAQGNVMAIV